MANNLCILCCQNLLTSFFSETFQLNAKDTKATESNNDDNFFLIEIVAGSFMLPREPCVVFWVSYSSMHVFVNISNIKKCPHYLNQAENGCMCFDMLLKRTKQQSD